MSRRESQKDGLQQLVSERIAILLSLAKSPPALPHGLEKKYDLPKKYFRLAMKLQQRHRVRIDKSVWRHFCKKCGCVRSLAGKGKNTSVAVDSVTKSVVYLCLPCGAKKRFFYSNKSRPTLSTSEPHLRADL